MHIHVTRQDSPTSQQEWRFYFLDRDATLYLDTYILSERPTTRHKFKWAKYYNRTDGRSNTIKLPDVPLPDDVSAEAMRKLVEMVSVKKWPERD